MYIFKNEPWVHQRKALEVSWNKTYFALLMDYGTGKTKVIIDNAGILFEQKGAIDALFIIAPNNVHKQWVLEQIPEHLPERIPRICRVWTGEDTIKFKKSLEDFWSDRNKNKLKIFSINVEAFQSSIRAQTFSKNFLKAFRSMLVIDESTRIKTPGTKRTTFIINNLSKIAPYRRTLTGNEITRSPFDIYSPYLFLSDSFWDPIPNYHIFTHKYAEWKKNFTFRKNIKVKDFHCPECRKYLETINIKRMEGFVFAVCSLCNQVLKIGGLPSKVRKLVESGGKFEYPTLLKYRNLDELRQKISSHSFQVRKEDCMDLPPKVYSPIYTEMNEEQKRIYKELKDNLFTVYQESELTVPNKIALTTRFQQIVGGFFPETNKQIGENNPKIDRLIYDLEDIDTPDPIIIWARFVIEIQEIAKRLKQEYPGKRIVTFYGETKKQDRAQIIEDFKNGQVDFFVANTMVAGTGLNLQRAYLQYYYSNSFMAEDRWQSEDRSHRGGQTHTCLYKDIWIKGTVDDTVMKANSTKKNLAEFFKDHSIKELV